MRPHGIVSPALWGDEERARRRLEPLLHGVTVRLRTVRIEFATADAMYEQLVPPAQRTCGRTFDDAAGAQQREPRLQPRPPPATC